MKRALFAFVGASILGVTGGLAIQAQAMPPPNGSHGLGHHTSSMAPDHPREHGQMFGKCVSGMARGDHHHNDHPHMDCDMNE